MKKKKVVSLLLLGCLAVNLVACSGGNEKDVDYNLNSSEGDGTKQEGVVGSTLAQFLNEEKWTESFTVTRENGQTMEIQIDGEISIPSVDYMSVMEVQVPSLDYSATEEMAGPTKQDFTTYGQGVSHLEVMGGVSRYISFVPEDRGAFHVPEEEQGECLRYCYWEDGWEESPGNLCGISEEEAEEMAAQFLEKMGISVSYYQIEKKAGILWCRELYSGDPFMEDGYYFRYTLKDDLGNELLTSLEKYTNIYEKISGTAYALDPKIEIYVVEEGVMEVVFANAVQVIGITKVQNYLSFESIKQSLRKVLSEEFDRVYIPRDINDESEELIINSAELTYFRIRDKEQNDHYSYIPVWLFCHHTEAGGELIDDTIYNPILINALDGSVIYLDEEF